MNLKDLHKQLRTDPNYISVETDLALSFHLGNEVLRARMKRGWTQTELARRVGTRQANISNIEAGLANPTLRLIQRICKELDLRIHIVDSPMPCSQTTTSSIRVDNAPNTPFQYRTGMIAVNATSKKDENWS